MGGKQRQLVLFRPAGWVGRARRIRMSVDGVEVGDLRSGRRLVVEIDAGAHVVDARFGANDISDPLQVDVGDVQPTTVAVTFLNPQSVPTPGVGGDWQRRSLELRIAPEGSVRQLGLLQAMSPLTGRRSRAERVVWAVATVTVVVGLALRGVSQLTGTLIAAVGALAIVVLFFRQMLFRDRRD